MRQETRASKEPAEKVVQDIRRATRKHYSAEEKIRIVLEGLRGEDSIAETATPPPSGVSHLAGGAFLYLFIDRGNARQPQELSRQPLSLPRIRGPELRLRQ
jgi:transposase